MTVQEEYASIADLIRGTRERAAKLATETGGEAVPKQAASLLVYHLRQAENEAKVIAQADAKEGTNAAHE